MKEACCKQCNKRIDDKIFIAVSSVLQTTRADPDWDDSDTSSKARVRRHSIYYMWDT